MPTCSKRIARIALAIQEQRHDLELSRRELAECAEVSEATVQRIERGVKVRSANLIRVAAALTTIELYSEPKPVQVAEQVDLPLALFSPSLTAVGWDLAS